MEMFAIFLFMAIGHVFGDLQGVETGKDELKAKEDAGEGLPPYVKEAINLDQYLQSKGVEVPAESSSSNEAEANERPASPELGSPLKFGAHEVHEETGKMVQLEERRARSETLNKSEEVMALDSFLGDSDPSGASVAEETSQPEKTGKLKREKRAAKKKKKAPKKKGRKPAKKAPKKSSNGYNDPPVTCKAKTLMNAAQIKEMIKSHNDARRREKASAMLALTWDPIAAKLAQQKASACEWGHSMITDCKGRGVGQSIWANWNNDGKHFIKLNISEVTYAWADEYKDWNYKTKTCNPGKICGHWEMLTGDKVVTVGCGAAKCVSMKMGTTHFGHANYVVCDYYPYYTKFQTGKACTKCSSTARTTPLKGYTCEKKLCVPCAPKKKKGCKTAYMDDNL